MADFNQQKTPTPLSEFRNRLIGAPLEGATRRPSLQFKILRNAMTLEARTNIPEDKDYGRIRVTFGPQDFFAFLELLSSACNAANDTFEQIAYADYPWTQQGRSKEKKLVAKVNVGKDAEGVVYISIQSWDRSRPAVVFPLVHSDFYHFTHADGSQWDKASISKLYAKAFAKWLCEIFPQAFYAEFNPPAPRNGGGGWNNNRSNRGSQGGQPQAAAPKPAPSNDSWGDDDFPL